MDDSQRVAAKIALAVPAADGFILAGGQALIEHGITQRQDVVIVGHEAPDPSLPLPIGLAGGTAFLAAGLFVKRSEKS